MAELHVFRLQPRGAFHFGTQGVGLEATTERCPSDTLYAALLMEAKRGRIPFPEPDADGRIDHLPFRLSSCFPYAGEALLFPLPRLKRETRTDLEPGQRKRLKKLRYISATLLMRMTDGEPVDTLSMHEYQNGAVQIAAVDGAERFNGPLWQESRIDHVTVDRVREASQYYAVGHVRFAPGCGLFILACVRDIATRDLLLELLTRLGHSGLGGKRSVGLGQFDVAEPSTIDLPDDQGCAQALLLSRYVPDRAELEGGVLGPRAAYDLVQTGGWLQSDHPQVRSLLRKPIHLLTEGSVLQCLPHGPITGRVIDVRPDGEALPHPVWRYGVALTIGIGRREAV